MLFFFFGIDLQIFESAECLKICSFLSQGATEKWNANQEVPYAFKNKEWVGYDNIQSFQKKVSSVN